MAWSAGVAFILWGSAYGALDPQSHAYEANWPGDVRRALIELTCETLVLYLLVRPHSYAASWGRSLLAVVLLVGWTLLGGSGALHGGPIGNYHYLWLLLMVLGFMVTLAISSARAIRGRQAAT